jgi:hypothetical protein
MFFFEIFRKLSHSLSERRRLQTKLQNLGLKHNVGRTGAADAAVEPKQNKETSVEENPTTGPDRIQRKKAKGNKSRAPPKQTSAGQQTQRATG